ncbi:MAG: hypothetical protein AAGF12_42035, partial [Myxococcota bacterium]
LENVMKKSPLQEVKDRFGGKAELISAVEALQGSDLWVDRVNDDKGLERVSNAKLLHLHDVLEAVKKEFGTRSDLISAIVKLENREKDTDYATHFDGWPTPRLYDYYRAAKKRS